MILCYEFADVTLDPLPETPHPFPRRAREPEVKSTARREKVDGISCARKRLPQQHRRILFLRWLGSDK